MAKLYTSGNYHNRDAATDAITNAPGAASALSVSGWLHIANANGNTQQPLTIGNAAGGYDFLFGVDYAGVGANTLRGYVQKTSTAQTIQVTTTPSASTWTHYAVTWDGTTLRLYVNGAEVGNNNGTITSQPAVDYLEIGFVNGATEAETIQDVCMFGVALTAGQVEQLARGRLPRTRTGLFVHWPLFAKSGNSVDYSGNNNHGVQNGTVADGAVDAPVGWASTSGRLYIPAASAVNFSSGVSDTTTLAQGTLRVRVITTSASAASVSAATGTLAVRVLTTSAAAATVSAAAATLNVRKTAAGVADSTSSATGTLATRVLFTSGTAATSSAASATLQVRMGFAGVASSVTAATATLKDVKAFAGVSTTTTAAQGELAGIGDVMFDSGTCTTTTAASATLRAELEFAAVATTTTAAQSTLRVEYRPTPACVTTTAAAATLRVVKEFETASCFSHSAARGQQTGGTAAISGGRDYLAQKRRFGAVGLRRKTR